jgi:Raf kinase inhibitor-like YbhB/YbcL family protein
VASVWKGCFVLLLALAGCGTSSPGESSIDATGDSPWLTEASTDALGVAPRDATPASPGSGDDAASAAGQDAAAAATAAGNTMGDASHGAMEASASTDAMAGGSVQMDRDATVGAMILTSTVFIDAGMSLEFPASACDPQNQSPPLSWSGAPAATRSFAITFVDDDVVATKWAIWDVPPTATSIPGNISQTSMPPEVPGASQLGSLGHTGYYGPGVPPPPHTYEFVLWALDVATLPGTSGLTPAQIRQNVLPQHQLATSAPLVAIGQQGGF